MHSGVAPPTFASRSSVAFQDFRASRHKFPHFTCPSSNKLGDTFLRPSIPLRSSMAPPTGPRASSHGSRPSLRGTRGGGVGKRRGTPRTDRDGDVSMDTVSPDNPPSGSAAHSGRGSRASKGGRGGRSSTRLAQNVRNFVSEQDGTVRNVKQPNKVTLKIRGLKDSKAASNPDGGLRSLLDFLERKSSKERPITLGRVRFLNPQPSVTSTSS